MKIILGHSIGLVVHIYQESESRIRPASKVRLLQSLSLMLSDSNCLPLKIIALATSVHKQGARNATIKSPNIHLHEILPLSCNPNLGAIRQLQRSIPVARLRQDLRRHRGRMIHRAEG